MSEPTYTITYAHHRPVLNASHLFLGVTLFCETDLPFEGIPLSQVLQDLNLSVSPQEIEEQILRDAWERLRQPVPARLSGLRTEEKVALEIRSYRHSLLLADARKRRWATSRLVLLSALTQSCSPSSL